MRLYKNKYFSKENTSKLVIGYYEYYTIVDNNKIPIMKNNSYSPTDEYEQYADTFFGQELLEKPLVYRKVLPDKDVLRWIVGEKNWDNKIKFYMKDRKQYEIFKKIIMLIKLSH